MVESNVQGVPDAYQTRIRLTTLRAEASNINAKLSTLQNIIKYETDDTARQRAIKNPKLPLSIAEKAARRSPELWEYLALRDDVTNEILNKIVCKSRNNEFLEKVLRSSTINFYLTENTLDTIVKNTNGKVKVLIAGHPNTPARTLTYLSNHLPTAYSTSDKNIRLIIINRIIDHQNTPANVLVSLYKQELLDRTRLARLKDIKQKIAQWLEEKSYGNNLENLQLEWLLTILDEAV